MQYVCHTRYKGKSLDGAKILIRRGKSLDRDGDMLKFDGHPVCIWRSLVGKQHFANDNDGHGLERGAITYALAYAPRERFSEDERHARQRFSDAELEVLSTRWAQYIKPNLDMLLFSDDFFELPVEKLREIAESVGVRP